MSPEPAVPGDRRKILIVDDEPGLAELYAEWLHDEYETQTTTSGSQALEILDEAIDVVLLDRRMPRFSGDDVLQEIRSRGCDCRVAMVTAVEPDFNIIEMGFDDYLVKPVARADLVDLVERLLTRSTYTDQVLEFCSLVSKKAILDAEKTSGELARSEEYDRLAAKIATARESFATIVPELDEADYRVLYRDIGGSITDVSEDEFIQDLQG